MSTEQIDAPPAPQEPAGGLDVAGSRLAAARRQQNMEPAAVAARLHLPVEVITAIEAGNLSGLPAMTFVRGYIKSYARLVGVDDQQILSLLPSTGSYRPAPLRAVGMKRSRRRRPIGKWFLWMLGAAALVVLVIYGVPLVERLWTRHAQPADGNALPLPLGEEHAPLAPLPPEGDAGTTEDEPAVIPESEYDTGEPPTASDEPQAAPLADAAPAAAQPEAPPTAPQPAADDSSGPALITLRFNEESWVEMESHGRKLVVGTQAAGSERSVRAEPPVQVLLGNAPGVSLEYRGKTVDLKNHQRGRVARLVLED